MSGLQHSNPTPTESAAANKVRAEPLRSLVLKWYREAGEKGLTKYEAGTLLCRSRGLPDTEGRTWYSARPRVTELVRMGYLRPAGGERDGAAVFVATDKIGDAREKLPVTMAGWMRKMLQKHPAGFYVTHNGKIVPSVT